jgi:hypothetical protein
MRETEAELNRRGDFSTESFPRKRESPFAGLSANNRDSRFRGSDTVFVERLIAKLSGGAL